MLKKLLRIQPGSEGVGNASSGEGEGQPKAETLEAETLEAETLEAETLEAETLEAETLEAETLEALDEQLKAIQRDALLKPSIRENAVWLREAAHRHFGPQDEVDEASLHRIMHALPVNMVEATVHLGIRLATNARLLAGWYRDRLVFLINAEKASSTLHEIAIRDMQLLTLGQEPNFGIQRGVRIGPTEPAYRAFHGLLPLFVPDGGVLRGPFLPHLGNVRFLDEIHGKMVLLCRHPADRLVARGCMTGAGFEMTIREDDVRSGRVFHTLIADDGLPQSLSVELQWLTGWLKARGGSERFLLARYEDMLADPRAHFDRLHQFITGQPMTQEVWQVISSTMARTAGGDLQPGDRQARHYPKGYSGKVGVWRDYLDARHIAAYNDRVRKFMNYHPNAALLLDVYPDIYLD